MSVIEEETNVNILTSATGIAVPQGTVLTLDFTFFYNLLDQSLRRTCCINISI